MSDNFDATKEPLRALRDLVVAAESIFDGDNGEGALLDRARDGLDTLRRLFGDARPADQVAYGPMREPVAMTIRILKYAAALRKMAVVSFNRHPPEGAVGLRSGCHCMICGAEWPHGAMTAHAEACPLRETAALELQPSREPFTARASWTDGGNFQVPSR